MRPINGTLACLTKYLYTFLRHTFLVGYTHTLKKLLMFAQSVHEKIHPLGFDIRLHDWQSEIDSWLYRTKFQL